MKNTPVGSENLKEQVSHGSQDFPLQIYSNMEDYEGEPFFYNHWHEEAEILCVTEGIMELVVDGVSLIARKNTVVLIPPNLLHGAYQYQKEKCRFSSIVFHPDFIASKNADIIQTTQLAPFLGNNFVTSYVIYYTDRKCELVQQLLRELMQCYNTPQPYRELLIKGFLYQILFHLLLKEEKYNVKSVSDYLNEDRKKKILTYIENNYQNPVTLSELADSVSLSKEQFCRFFKGAFRSTPMHYLSQYRIKRSISLLRETNLSIIDIAIDVGFDSSNYFAISFKKTTGMTPSQFRNMT